MPAAYPPLARPRFDLRLFTVHAPMLGVGLLLLLAAGSPLAQLGNPYAVNQTLSFSLHYAAGLCFLLAFRARGDWLKTLHIFMSVAWGIVPLMFLSLCLTAVLLLLWMYAFFATIFIWGSDEGWLWETSSLATQFFDPSLIILIAQAVVVTFVVWYFLITVTFAQYSRHRRLEFQSRRATVALLIFFFGFLGAHRWYLGRWRSGLLYLCTMAFMGFGLIIDFLLLLCNRLRDAKGTVV